MKKYLKDFLCWVGKGIYINLELLIVIVGLEFVEIKNFTPEGCIIALAWIVYGGANKVIDELKNK